MGDLFEFLFCPHHGVLVKLGPQVVPYLWLVAVDVNLRVRKFLGV